MEKTITISLFNRPDYTRRTLEYLFNCYGVEDYNISIFIEPVSQEVINIAVDYSKKCKNINVFVNKIRLGCNRNIFQSLSYAFDKLQSRFNIHVEDDVLLAKDALNYFDWCNQTYYKDDDVFTVSSYERSKTEDKDQTNLVKRHCWFIPWGWATWSNRWQGGFKEELLHKISQKQYESWDCHTNKIRNGRYEIRPVIARSQNIGAEGGIHVPSAEWHKKNQYNDYWIESVGEYVKHFEELI